MDTYTITGVTSMAIALRDDPATLGRWLLEEVVAAAQDFNMTNLNGTTPAPAPDSLISPLDPQPELMTRPMSGPGGAGVDFFLSFWPLIFLLLVTLIKWILLPTSVSLPVAAFMLWLIRLMYFANPSNYINALAISGLFEAITPLSIIFGAILLFQTMHHTKCLPWLMGQIKALSGGHPVAEVFLISWSFAYLVEGASGFGTPVALAAPMLTELGHDPVMTITCCLIMNTLATQFGAVGTPIWFGFGGLGLSAGELQQIGLQAAFIVGATAFVIPVLASMLLIKVRVVMRNMIFILLSILSAVGPSIGIAFFSYEFPSLIGGLVSLLLTGLLVKFKIGLADIDEADKRGADDDELGAIQLAEGARDLEGDFKGGSDDLDNTMGSKMMVHGRGAEVLRGNNLRLVEGMGLVAMPPSASMNFNLTLDYPHKSTQDAAVGCNLDKSGSQSEGSFSSGLKVSIRPKGGSFSSSMRGSSHTTRHGKGKHGDELTPIMHNDDEDDFAETEKEVYLDEILQKTAEPTRDGDMEISPLDPNVALRPKTTFLTVLGRTMPIWATILLLLITRIPQLKVKGVLQSTKPNACVQLGSFGKFCISASIVMQILGLFNEPVNWKYEFLYIPFFIPFTVVSIVTILIYIRSFDKGVRVWTPFVDAGQRVAAAVIPNLGALVLVQLLRQGGPSSPAFVIGYWLSEWLGVFFILLSAFLGALGSFFSGSTTVSNLTFGDIQKIAALTIGKPVTTMLAIQVSGATMGNMICLSNVIAAKAVLNLSHMSEGVFIGKTAGFGVLMGIIATAVGYAFMHIPFFYQA